MNNKQIIGKFGEDLAEKYLLSKGYKIIARNYQTSYQEIDIIALDKAFTVFIEVKTRATSSLGGAEDAFGTIKFDNLKKAINRYIRYQELNADFVRLDLISVDICKKTKIAKIKHMEEIF